MAELSPEASKILQARKDAASELSKIDGEERALTDADVIRLSNARLYEAAVMLRIVGGENVPASEAKAASEMVEEARGYVRRTHKVVVEFVGAEVRVCPHCNRDLDAKPLPSSPKQIDGEVVRVIDAVEQPQPVVSANDGAASQQPPKKKDAPPATPSPPRSIHDGAGYVRPDANGSVCIINGAGARNSVGLHRDLNPTRSIP